MGQVAERRTTEAERIADAYLDRAGGDLHTALRLAIEDALADLCEAERRGRCLDRLLSAGYVRRGLRDDASDLA